MADAESAIMPLYGFLQGDTLGLVILARRELTVGELAEQLQVAASVRVAPRREVDVLFNGQVLNPRTTLANAGLAALDRFDVVPRGAA